MLNNRKKIIIVALVIVLLFVVGVLALRYVRQNNLLTFEEKANRLLLKRLEEAKQEQGHSMDLTKLKVYNPVTEDDCRKNPDQSKRQLCLDRLEYFEVLGKEKPESCRLLNGKFREACYHNLGRAESGIEICLKIGDKKLRSLCIADNAFLHKSTSTCVYLKTASDAIKNAGNAEEEEEEEEENECIDRVRAISNGGLTEDDANGDVRNCLEVKTLEYFNQCILRSRNSCVDLEDKDLINQCQSIRYFSSVISMGRPEDCNLFPLEKFRKVCQVYFKHGKKFIDSDGGGLTDNQELWFNTDPFVVDKEEKTIQKNSLPRDYFDDVVGKGEINEGDDGDEIKNNTDPLAK